MFGKRCLLIGTLALFLGGCGQGNRGGAAPLAPIMTSVTDSPTVLLSPSAGPTALTPTALPLPTYTPAPPDWVRPTAYPTPTIGPFPADFELTLTSNSLEGPAPLQVRFTATLTGGRDDSYELYCVGETWDFGNGEGMTTSPLCVEWTPEMRVIRTYTTAYTYKRPGTYLVRMRIAHGPYEINSTVVTVVVH